MLPSRFSTLVSKGSKFSSRLLLENQTPKDLTLSLISKNQLKRDQSSLFELFSNRAKHRKASVKKMADSDVKKRQRIR
jgi:hypothetical protein